MKLNEIRQMTKVELEQKLESLKEGLFKLRFSRAMGKLDTPWAFKSIKKDVARIKTILAEQKKQR